MSLKKLLAGFLVLSLSTVVFAADKKNVLKKDNVYVEYVEQNGGVLLYHIAKNGKKTAVIEDVDYGSSSFIGVLIDNTYYNLKTSGSVKYECETTENSLSITYKTNRNVDIVVTYTVPAKNVLRTDCKVINLDSVEHIVQMKSIYDTVLGEWNGTLFSTSSKSKIKSEYIITDFQKHKVLTSTDGITGIRFFLDKDLSAVAYKVVVAARPFLETDDVDGRFFEGRGFNTVLSYNNSAVGIFYKTINLKPGTQITLTNRIEFDQAVLSTMSQRDEDERNSADKPYIYGTEFEKTKEDSENEIEPETETVVPEETASQEVDEKDSEKSDVQEEIISDDTVPQKEEKVDPEYVRNLVERIHALEDTGKDTDHYEIYKLQQELNAVLKKLGSGK